MKIMVLILFIGLLPFNSMFEINSVQKAKCCLINSSNSSSHKNNSLNKPEIISEADMSKMIGGCGGSKCSYLFHSCSGSCTTLSVTVCSSGSGNCIEGYRFVSCACSGYNEYISGCW